MKLLLDHCVPKRLGRELSGHECRTAFQMGWANLGNGSLLKKAAEDFGAFITVDQNLEYQNNLRRLPLAVIVIVAEDNKLATLKPFVQTILIALTELNGTPLIRIHRDGRIEKIRPSV